MLPETAAATPRGHLAIGGCDVVELAATHGTPLYVYDEVTIRGRARAYREALKSAYPARSLVCYAAKAYCAPWLLKVIAEEALGLDVVSGGELFMALHSGFPIERVYFHGNNKSDVELRQAVDAGVSRIVVDNLDEIDMLERTCDQQEVLLRVAPSVEAHTHAHILTGALDTKFGLSIETGAAEQAARRILQSKRLRLVGLHAHIGSQIFELEPYRQTLQRTFDLAARLRDEAGFRLREISPGGGYGVRYSSAEDEPIPPAQAARAVAEAVCDAAAQHGFSDLPALTIEPGRSIVAPSAVAVYRVGSIKHIEGVRTYVAMDGGMADNIRPTAYGARYTPLLANRVLDEADALVAVAGRYCESGDVLVKDASLPMPRVGDLIGVPASGAYQLSMASNYNMVPRPAVVVVSDGQARLVRRRETYEDLLSAERF
ncbi:MAG: diaminopimelate decarboxylase [Chloroflexi bacterium]|nr:diaminopimelate decarboxylase [Chloroflexota bacterium]